MFLNSYILSRVSSLRQQNEVLNKTPNRWSIVCLNQFETIKSDNLLKCYNSVITYDILLSCFSSIFKYFLIWKISLKKE